jgi:hypothetical protein
MSGNQTSKSSEKKIKMKRRKKEDNNESTSTEEETESAADSKTCGVAYAIFSLQNQEIIRNELPPNASIDLIAKTIEQRWSGLLIEERQHWERLARQRWERASHSTNSTSSEDTSKPKRPLSAYFYYAKEMRPKIKSQYPTLGGNDVTKQIGFLWSQLDINERQPYIVHEARAKSAYDEALSQWKSSLLAKAPENGESAKNNVTSDEESESITKKQEKS